MKRLLAVLLCSLPAYAEPPFLPIASCEGDVCTMSRKDFEQFQAFHAAVFKGMEELTSELERQEGAIASLTNKLNRTPHCQMRSL